MYVCIYIYMCVCVRVCVYLFPHRTRTCTHTSRFSSMMIGKWMVVPKILNFPCYHHLNYLKLCRCPVELVPGVCWRLRAGPDPGSPWPRPRQPPAWCYGAAAPCSADGDASLGWRWWDHPRHRWLLSGDRKVHPERNCQAVPPNFRMLLTFNTHQRCNLGFCSCQRQLCV